MIEYASRVIRYLVIASAVAACSAGARRTGASSTGSEPGSTGTSGAIGSSVFSCGGPSNCDDATSYCLGGAIPNSCEPLPQECGCAETHDCACLLRYYAPSPSDTGLVTCTAYADGGELWLSQS